MSASYNDKDYYATPKNGHGLTRTPPGVSKYAVPIAARTPVQIRRKVARTPSPLVPPVGTMLFGSPVSTPPGSPFQELAGLWSPVEDCQR